ncbi:2-iminoacetate synthase [Dethiosulfatibacter aminovorans DSM 17477]|uniref:2-iminoacetate synthase n=1 Tax=Dethiosulfatibacter aminovorans DSM 17477 TaxID=1121476 RepID=A0A1M6IPE4_9FIRM|nr:2-iminoacetate synthase ThiH [Dethiosulfatibacter aminovorans]SHJ36297.1 2-iminoacetate synthase [Dethiosulfatibacter aminovorans DSM 17477]
MAGTLTNHMEYMDNMERTDSEIMERVLDLAASYDYDSYTKEDVMRALEKENMTIDDFGAVLSTAAVPFLEKMARKAKGLTERYFGNSVSMFTPLYIANYCENHCVYCGFNCMNRIKRGRLSLDEIDSEMRAIAETGLKEILILTGESRIKSDLEYIGAAVKTATRHFSTVGIEIYPLNSEEYGYLKDQGADFVSVYQETYNTDKYGEVHLKGPKRVFPYRFNSQERALKGGMRGVAFGALLGLDDFRKDVFAAGIHAYLVQKKYPHGEISFSTPRIRPFINNSEKRPSDVYERELLQVMLSYRLFMPYAGITISTRENARFRDNVVGLVATKISAGVSTGVGGHGEDEKGDEQFEISDERSVDEVHRMIVSRGLQPVYRDYIRV